MSALNSIISVVDLFDMYVIYPLYNMYEFLFQEYMAQQQNLAICLDNRRKPQKSKVEIIQANYLGKT